jgi:hypothetical protein
MRSLRLAGLTALVVLGASCGEGSPPVATPTTVTPSRTEGASPAPVPGEEDRGEEVTFRAEDGTRLLPVVRLGLRRRGG